MTLYERHKKILSRLYQDQIVYTSQLKGQFHTSFETIRKDLQYLESQGLLKRIHGGAVPADEEEMLQKTGVPVLPLPEDFLRRRKNHSIQKQQIAKKACEFIQEGTCIALDTGTTSYELCLLLLERFQKLTIVTNSMINAMILSQNPDFTVIVTGGIVSREMALISEFIAPVLDNLNIETMFLTTCGIDPRTGIAEQTVGEISIHKKMAARSRQLIVLADSSKFSMQASFHAYDFREIHCIITDELLDKEIQADYRKIGVAILIAQP